MRGRATKAGARRSADANEMWCPELQPGTGSAAGDGLSMAGAHPRRRLGQELMVSDAYRQLAGIGAPLGDVARTAA